MAAAVLPLLTEFNEWGWSVECLAGEVADTHARFLEVELVHAHVLFAQFDRSVVERGAAVHACGDDDLHVGGDDLPVDAPHAFGRDSENFAHSVDD